MKRVTLLIPALIILLLALPLAVFADTRSKDLPEDRQPEGKLAIDSWESGHLTDRAPGHDVVYHRITLAEPWDNDLLRDAGPERGYIELRFKVWDRRGDVQNRVAKIEVNPDGGLSAMVTDARVEQGFFEPLWHSQEPVFGHTNVWRPDERSVQIEFHERLLNIDKWPYGVYRWAVATIYVDDTGGTPCGDPNLAIDPEGCRDKTFFIRHDLRK